MADAQGNRYGPYDIEVAGSEAEAFTEDAWYLMNRQSGVMSGGALTFTGLTAHLAPVELRSHGSFLAREAEWTDASPVTTGAAPRRDLLVARRQLTVGSGESAVPGKTFLTVLRGAPAATPADPDNDPDNDELLWSWQVPASGGTVVTAIRDLRRSVGGWRTVGTPGDSSYSHPALGTWANLPGMVATIQEPAGVTVELEFEATTVDVATSASVFLRLQAGGVTVGLPHQIATSTATVAVPARLRGKFVSTGAAVVVAAQISGAVNGGFVKGGTATNQSGQAVGGGVALRYRVR